MENERASLCAKNVLLKTGVHLHAVECGDEDGTPVVFLHGYGDSSYSFAPLFAQSLPSCRLIAPDLRGHGASDKPEGDYSIARFAEDIVDFLDSEGLEKAVIAGHSMGSFVAQRLAADYPDRVAALVLIGSAASAADSEVLKDLAKQVDLLEDPVDVNFVRDFQTPSVPLPESFISGLIYQSLEIPAFVWKRCLANLLETDHQALLSRIECPTAVFWGRNDGIFGQDQQDKLMDGLPFAAFKAFDGGHAFHWETPEALSQDLIGFIAKIDPRDRALPYRTPKILSNS
jgi:pimeloyl-ACP methyl ester carboxylesterase